MSERVLLDLLRQIHTAEDERLISRSVCFESLAPGEDPDENWKEISSTHAKVLRSAIRRGYVNETFSRWTPDWPDEYCPDGGDHTVQLTGAGEEYLLAHGRGWLAGAVVQVVKNIPTIVTSVASALLIAYLLNVMGLRK